MNREINLVKNTIIYAIGNISSKLLSYFMILLYSYYISPNDLGYYDVIMSTIFLIVPIIMFEIHEGVYRLMIEKGIYSIEVIISSSLKFLLMAIIIYELLLIIILNFIDIEFINVIAYYTFTYMIYVFMTTVIRGSGNNKFYAIIGVINSVFILLFEFIGIVVFKLGIVALFMGMGIANTFCILLILVKNKTIIYSMKCRSKFIVLKEILQYSMPIIPTTICWWIVDACDRYIILFNLGKEYNGIYAMAVKFPTLITSLTSIFYLAWQESAIKEYNSSSRDIFFTKVYKKYNRLLFSICICCIPGTKIIVERFLSDDYHRAWVYTGPLFVATAYMALSSFLGLGYQISKETKRSTLTSVIAAVINSLLNILFIKSIGLYAASLSTLIAYFVLFIIRIWDTKKYFSIQYKLEDTILLPVMSFIVIVLTFYFSSCFAIFLLILICILVAIYLNKNIVMIFFIKVKNILFYN